MYDVVTIGSTVRDAFFKTNFKVVRYSKTPTGKALLVPFGEKFGVEEIYFTLGGNSANAAVTFARQGYKTAVATKIGNDAAGEEMVRYLKKEKVNTAFIKKSSLPTAYSVLMLQGGERTILTYHGAINEFSLQDYNPALLRAKWWYISLPGESYKSLGTLLRFARQNNILVALNPSFKHLIEGRRELVKALKDVAFLVVNRGEAAELTGIPFIKERDVFKRLDELTPGIVAVTAGSRGVQVSDGQRLYEAKVFKEKRVVDRTGAGDAFGSGFVAGLLRKGETCKKGVCNPANIEYAIRLASANSTSVVECLGATEGALTKRGFEGAARFKKFHVSVRKLL